ncbi:M48 family metalloprotease [Blastopirellula sp. JC732]|uniref:M48 family metalloprotease n=1 Tax=Blastopirellula sediminis TaxID=2894196 RepID=A0A9X1SIP4_9BACT|nr:M48 family metalloprotease [Blastopirellula sediminis]MCC9605203.1 M48 family metalloprotease [Blastopirellula sediminis]MCC9631497.1 M48 family metalloprotease [Blastopirellula sediminis]
MLLQILVYCTIVLLARPLETVEQPLASWLVCLALGLLQWSVARTFKRGWVSDICWGATSLLMLWPGNWGAIVATSALGEIPFLREAMLLSPAIVSRLVLLAETDGLSAALVEMRMSLPLACGPVWLGSSAARWGGIAGPGSDGGVLTIVLIVVMLIAVYPELLRRCWGLSPIQLPELTKRLQSQHGRSMPPLLVWPESISICNAALLGCVPPFRYLVVSTPLLDALTPGELDAVIAHEMGHLRKQHVARRLAAIVIPAAIVLVGRYLLAVGIDLQGAARTLAEASAPLLLTAYYLWSTPRQSRRLELEADAWAATHLKRIYGDQGPELLTSALRKLSVAADIPLEQSRWLHPSFRERESALQEEGIAHPFPTPARLP